MYKRIISVLIIAALMAAVLVGCGNNGADTETTTATPTGTVIQNTDPSINYHIDLDELTYTQFNALTPEQQQLVMASFGSDDAFFAWYTQAKADYEAFQNFLNSGNTESTEPSSGNADGENTDSTTGETSGENTGETTGETTPPVTTPVNKGVTFLEYQAMSGPEQMRFMSSFPSVDAFIQWHAQALQEYKDSMKEWGSDNAPTNPTLETEG